MIGRIAAPSPSRGTRFAAPVLMLTLFTALILVASKGSDLAKAANIGSADVEQADFSICGRARRINCIVDGDTFWYRGEKIRIADINTPEISRPKCALEKRLGIKAQQRLHNLMNAERFSLVQGARNRDRYGRLLRTVKRGGRSLGAILVEEGLAHIWHGRRESWCDNAV